MNNAIPSELEKFKELLSDIGNSEIMVILVPNKMTGRADCHIFTSRFLSFVPDSEIHKIVEKAMDDTLDDVRSHYLRTHPDPMNGYAVLRIQVSDEMMNYFMSRKLKCE